MNVFVLIIKILGIFFSSYFFWKMLREDFSIETIFPLTILGFFVSFIFGRLFSTDLNRQLFSGNFLNWFKSEQGLGFSLPIAFIALMSMVRIYTARGKLNFWEVADAVVFSFLVAVSLFAVGGLVKSVNFAKSAVLVFALLAGFLTKKMSLVYRSFSWYPSGKVGFLACVGTIAFFSPFLLLEIIAIRPLYFEMLSCILVLTGGVISLYYRSGRDIKKDLLNRNGN